MALLQGIIPPQKYELVRDRIGQILAEEFRGQNEINPDADIDPTVYIERFVPFDITELPAINIALISGDYTNKDARSADGTYTFAVDVYVNAASTDDGPGDAAATILLHKIAGMARAILENPAFKTLLFASPSLSNVHVSRLSIADPSKGESTSMVMARIEYSVRVPETVELKDATPIANAYTRVKLALTDKGYVYEYDNEATYYVSQSGDFYTNQSNNNFITN